MGAAFSASEYTKQIISFNENTLGNLNDEEINLFLAMSSDFYNVFSSSTLEDYRQMKKRKPENLIYLISQVSTKFYDIMLGHKSYAWRSHSTNTDLDSSLVY